MDFNMIILYMLEKLRVPFFHYLFLGISYLGSEVTAAIAVFVVYWCVNKRKGLFLLVNCLIASGINQIVKLLCHVPRPFVAHEDFSISDSARATAGGFSFPSGHTQNSTSLYGSIAYLWKNRGIRILCAVMIALVAFSRMYLGAHYPTDVLGGFACGLLVLVLSIPLYRKSETHPNLIPVLLGIGGVIMVAALLMFESGSWREMASPEEMKEMLKGIGICAGCALAAAVCEPVERKFVRFETDAVWWAQILKTAAGFGLLVVLALVMKYPAAAVFGESGLAYVFRFFVPVAFGVCIWPMTFKWFSKLGR